MIGVGHVRQTPADEQERRQAAVAHLEKRGFQRPVFHFFDAGLQGGVKATWPWDDGCISYVRWFELATPYVVTAAELDVAAAYLTGWFIGRQGEAMEGHQVSGNTEVLQKPGRIVPMPSPTDRTAYLEHALREIYGKTQWAMGPDAGLRDYSDAICDIHKLVEKALQPGFEPAVVKELKNDQRQTKTEAQAEA